MAGFDRSQSLSLEGVVKDFAWQNPHAWIELEVTKDGKTVTWNFEMTLLRIWCAQDGSSSCEDSGGDNFIRAVATDGLIYTPPATQTPPNLNSAARASLPTAKPLRQHPKARHHPRHNRQLVRRPPRSQPDGVSRRLTISRPPARTLPARPESRSALISWKP